ncbi:MAG: hypothetical protein J7L04_05670 [Bacteroidales bacterium]|nr:hypothetical protein [Bacteroidales bacterium]
MKIQKYTIITILLLLFSITAGNVFAQDSNKKIHLKVIKNGETTVDTSFAVESLESDDLHKKIFELAGVDVNLHKGHEGQMHMVHAGEHGSHTWTSHDEKGGKVIIMKSDSTEVKDGKSKKVAYFYSSDDDNFIMKTDSNVFIVADTIILKKEGNVIIMDGDDGEFEWTSKETGEGEMNVEVIVENVEDNDGHKIYIIKKGEHGEEGGEKVIVKKLEGNDSTKVYNIKVVKVQKGDGEEENTTVYVISGGEGEPHVHTSKNVSVIISDGEKDSMVTKEVKVMKSVGDDDVIEIIVEIEEGENVKFEGENTKKSRKTKQKKEKKRTSK